jgi:hypothetical protein
MMLVSIEPEHTQPWICIRFNALFEQPAKAGDDKLRFE